ncbi:MAG TPA: tetratricopeptide repeat protein [Rhizomicrobium sp.]
MTSSKFAPLFIALLLCGLGGCASDDAAALPAPTQTAAAADAPINPANLDADIRQAQLQRVAHDLDGATRTLSQLMLMAPDDPRVIGEYGKVLAEKGRAAEAVQFLNRAIELRSNDWTIYSALGVADDQLGKQNDARLAYEQALLLQPGEPSVLSNYALSRMLAGDPAGAQRLMAMAVAHGGAADPQIARNIALVNALAPAPAAVAALPAPAAVAAAPFVPAPMPVASSAPRVIAPVLAHATPAAPRVVMEAVPYDPLSGPVAASHPPRKLIAARHPVHPVRHIAVHPLKPANLKTADAKPVVPAPKPTAKVVKKDAPPALRMTADARTP